jgi:hypothetical protein
MRALPTTVDVDATVAVARHIDPTFATTILVVRDVVATRRDDTVAVCRAVADGALVVLMADAREQVAAAAVPAYVSATAVVARIVTSAVEQMVRTRTRRVAA